MGCTRNLNLPDLKWTFSYYTHLQQAFSCARLSYRVLSRGPDEWDNIQRTAKDTIQRTLCPSTTPYIPWHFGHNQSCDVSWTPKASPWASQVIDVNKNYTARFDISTWITFSHHVLCSKSLTTFKLLQDLLLQIIYENGPWCPKLPVLTYITEVLIIWGKSETPDKVLTSPAHMIVAPME